MTVMKKANLFLEFDEINRAEITLITPQYTFTCTLLLPIVLIPKRICKRQKENREAHKDILFRGIN